MFGIKHKLRSVGTLPPKTSFYLFNTSVRPILTYGSDVWGVYKSGRDMVDKQFLQFLKHTLGVKQSTSSLFVYGEAGQFPPSIDCIYNTLCFLNRIIYMDRKTLIRQVYDELNVLQDCGFQTWSGKAWELMHTYSLLSDPNHKSFKKLAKSVLNSKFIQEWSTDVANIHENPIARTYSLFKHTFGMEAYLHKVSNFKYRQAITKLRTSSHDLMIERGRHCLKKMSIEERVCPNCNQIEDEMHFLISCSLYSNERNTMYKDIEIDKNIIDRADSVEIFHFLMTLKHQSHLEKLGEFIYSAFNKRKQITYSQS